MQVSYHGGSPLYFWPNYSLASRANPDVENCDRPVTEPKVPSVSLSFFPASFSLRLSPSPGILTFPLVIFFRWLRGVRYFLYFFSSNHSALLLSSFSISLVLSLSLFFFFIVYQHRRFVFSVSSRVPLFPIPLPLSAGCRQIGSRRPAVKFILLPCTATMIAASAF